MEYSAERVRALSDVAHIALSDEEVQRLRRELGALRALADVLENVPVETEGADPFLNAVPLDGLRADRAIKSENSETWLSASKSEDGFFIVPRAVEE